MKVEVAIKYESPLLMQKNRVHRDISPNVGWVECVIVGIKGGFVLWLRWHSLPMTIKFEFVVRRRRA